MNCAWNELLRILPSRMRREVDMLGKVHLQEIRLRMGNPPELVMQNKVMFLMGLVTSEELNYIVNSACAYSPWAAGTVARGYLTAPGGHRIGLCGNAVMHGDQITGIKNLRSVNIRVARDFPGIGQKLENTSGSVLIIGCPGSGKTTLLRDLIRMRSVRENVAVVDERGELFPAGAYFEKNARIDILTGSPKPQGIEMLLRTMGPAVIAVDEITAQEDCLALNQAGWCGVKLLATAHAADRKDLNRRKIYRDLLCNDLFDYLVILSRDKLFRLERIKV